MRRHHAFGVWPAAFVLAVLVVAGSASASSTATRSAHIVTVRISDGRLVAPATIPSGTTVFVVVDRGAAEHRVAIGSEVGLLGQSPSLRKSGSRARFTVFLTPDVYTLSDTAAGSHVHRRTLVVLAPTSRPTVTDPTVTQTCDDATETCTVVGH